jgi:hypothetical protein
MNLASIIRRPGAGIAPAAIAAGLAVAGCGSGGGTAAGPGSGPASSQPASGGPASSGSAAQDGSAALSGLFPVAVGNTWVYQEKLNTTQGTVTNQVATVTPTTGGDRVTMKTRNDLSGLPHTASRATFILHHDGTISVPLTQLGSGLVKVRSGSIVWPSAAQLASGRPTTDTLVLTVTAAGHSATVRAHVVVRGAGTQTVRVPAGTYQATVIQETMREKIMGFGVRLVIRTWVAQGVGPVKSEVVNTGGAVSTVSSEQELKSFTRG